MKIYVTFKYLKEEFQDRYEDITVIDINDVSKYKGDILIIDLDQLENLNEELFEHDSMKYKYNYKKYDLYEFDRLNRYKYRNYKKVIIVAHNEYFDEYKTYKNQYSNIYFALDLEYIDFNIIDNKNKISNIKNNNILKLIEYVDKQSSYFDSKPIMKLFNVSNRWIKRYMKDMNDIYNNIGYSYSKRKWYKVKKR